MQLVACPRGCTHAPAWPTPACTSPASPQQPMQSCTDLACPPPRYAIAMAFRDKQRVIYTSPIKALSNQKFRELQVSGEGAQRRRGAGHMSAQAPCLACGWQGRAVLAVGHWRQLARPCWLPGEGLATCCAPCCSSPAQQGQHEPSRRRCPPLSPPACLAPAGGVWRRGHYDWRRGHQPQRQLHRDDHRDP